MTVCGALMRDLKWNKDKSKALRKDRLQKNRDKRKNKSCNQSMKTTVSNVELLHHKQHPRGFLSTKELKQLLQGGETPGEVNKS
jgi:hypothetical protein